MLNLDVTTLTTTAFTILNSFWPLIAAIAGLGLGFSFVKKIPGMFKNMI